MSDGEHPTRCRSGDRARNSGRRRWALPLRASRSSSGRPVRDSARSRAHHATRFRGPRFGMPAGGALLVGSSTGSNTAVAQRRPASSTAACARAWIPWRRTMSWPGRSSRSRRRWAAPSSRWKSRRMATCSIGPRPAAPCRDLLDPRRIGVRSGDLDAHPRLGERRRVHRPGDGRHLVAAFDERACERGERQDVADRPDRGQGDPHQMALIRRGAVRGP